MQALTYWYVRIEGLTGHYEACVSFLPHCTLEMLHIQNNTKYITPYDTILYTIQEIMALHKLIAEYPQHIPSYYCY